MLAEIYWIKPLPYRLAIMPRPRGGEWLEDEIRSLRAQGIDVLVSLLTPDEIAELELEHEAPCCASAGIEFLSLPIEDRSVPPDPQAARELIERLAVDLRGGKASPSIAARASAARLWWPHAFWPGLAWRQPMHFVPSAKPAVAPCRTHPSRSIGPTSSQSG